MRVEDADIARIKKIPLVDIPRIVNEPIEQLEIIIDPHTIIHATRLTYLFGQNPKEKKDQDQIDSEWVLFEKIVENLNIEFDKRGWMNGYTPIIDSRYNEKACFTLRMHKNGRFEIPIKRGQNLKTLFSDLWKAFSFLSKNEFEYFINLLRLFDKNTKQYVHLANRISPDDIAKEKLDKAKLSLKRIDHFGSWKVDAEVDASDGLEIELKGPFPQTWNANQVLAVPHVVAGTLENMDDKINDIKHYSFNQLNGQVLLQQQIQGNHGILRRDSKIFHKDMRSQLGVINRKFSRLQDKISEIKTNHEVLRNENFYYHDEQSKKTIDILSHLGAYNGFLSKSIDLNYRGQRRIEKQLESNQLDTFSEFNNVSEKIENLGIKIDEKITGLEDLIKNELNNFRNDVQNNLTLVLMNISRLQGLSTRQIINHLELVLNRSKRTIYNYLNKLHASGYLDKNKIKKHRPGRPSFNFTISNKFKILKEKLTKNTRLELDNE